MSLPYGTEEWRWYAENIFPRHWERLAVVDVRHSTRLQVLDHQASTRLPYGLVRRAVAWVWPEARVLVMTRLSDGRAPVSRGVTAFSGWWRKWG